MKSPIFLISQHRLRHTEIVLPHVLAFGYYNASERQVANGWTFWLRYMSGEDVSSALYGTEDEMRKICADLRRAIVEWYSP